MKNLFTLFITALALFGCGEKGSVLTPVPLSGNAVGNGGDVVSCPGKQPVLLDAWELSEMYQWKIELGAEAAYKEKVSYALNRLSKLDKERAERYQASLESFEDEAVFLENTVLTDIPDSLNVALPKGCELKQIAVQQKQNTKKDPKYVISKDLWNQLDSDNQAALVLHEIIYREAYQYRNHEDSKSVRGFNAYVLSGKGFKNTEGKKYQELLADLKLPAWVNGVPVKPESISVMDGVIKYAELVEGGAYKEVGPNTIYFGGHLKVEFYPSGAVKKGNRGWTNKETKINVMIGVTALPLVEGAFIEFYENGEISAVDVGLGFPLIVQGVEASFYSTSENDVTKFYVSGKVQEGTLASPVRLKDETGVEKEYSAKTRLLFDENGLVLKEIK